jgi:hypothetical protein
VKRAGDFIAPPPVKLPLCSGKPLDLAGCLIAQPGELRYLLLPLGDRLPCLLGVFRGNVRQFAGKRLPQLAGRTASS